MAGRLRQLDLYLTAIPMRSFEHAAALRDVAQAVIVRTEFDDGTEGWGESLPRQYVTGETLDGVVDDIEQLLFPACRNLDFARPDCLSALPVSAPGGRCINAALCAVTLAVESRKRGHSTFPCRVAANVETNTEKLNVPFSGRRIHARVSGVLGSADPARTARRLRLMRLYGLRDFKLKLGLGAEIDAQNLRLVHGRLRRGIATGELTLRVDVNGGWDAATTPDRVADLVPYGVCVVEQPVFCPAGQLAELAQRCALPLMADESLLTPDDAEILSRTRQVWWNIRISKNGGLVPALALAAKAAANAIPFTVGCMVGESSILSAAQRRLLQACPPPRFVEGNYGRFLLSGDLTTRSLRFGYGGRLGVLGGPGLGVQVDRRKLQQFGRMVRTLRA
jgi:muconate cycloisomerase